MRIYYLSQSRQLMLLIINSPQSQKSILIYQPLCSQIILKCTSCSNLCWASRSLERHRLMMEVSKCLGLVLRA